MSTASPATRAAENATQIAYVAVTGVWLAALVTGQGWWLAFLLVGYLVLVPVTALLFGDREDIRTWWDGEWTDDRPEDGESEASTAPAVTAGEEGTTAEAGPEGDTAGGPDDEALATLRERYARGELTDEAFERKLDRLVETGPLEDRDHHE